MPHRLDIPSSIRSVLVTRVDGLGDLVLGTALLSGLHRLWPDAQIKLLVRPRFAAAGEVLPDWVQVIPLPFERDEPIHGNEDRLATGLRSAAEQCRADLAINAEYNSVWASQIVAGLCGAKRIVAFDGPSGLNINHRPILERLGLKDSDESLRVHVEEPSREIRKYSALLEALGAEPGEIAPSLSLRDQDCAAGRELWAQKRLDPSLTLVFFPSSGEGLGRSLPAELWVKWIAHVRSRGPVVVLGSDHDAPVLQALRSAGLPADVPEVLVPPAELGLLAGFLRAAKAYIGADTGPMHVAAALGKPALGVYGGGHRAERFLPVGARAAAIRMPLGCYGCDWHCPFDSRLCVSRMPSEGVLATGDRFLNEVAEGAGNASAIDIPVFDLQAPADLPLPLLGAVMRQHRQYLDLQHRVIEYHQHVANVFTEMTRHNNMRDYAINHINNTLAEMTLQNQARDLAIAGFRPIILPPLRLAFRGLSFARRALRAVVNRLRQRRGKPMSTEAVNAEQ